ncbi:MAG: ferritin family protein [Pseudomonadota bacterium]
MKEDLTVLEILGLAVRSEEEAAAFYGSLAEMIKNDLVRARYESLAKEEVAHRQMLVALYRKMTGEKGAPPRIPGDPETAEGGRPPASQDSLEGLLKLAIERERAAHDFYLRAASGAVEPTARRIFEYLADIERSHEDLIKTELDAYLRDSNWYAEKPDVQLVGP